MDTQDMTAAPHVPFRLQPSLFSGKVSFRRVKRSPAETQDMSNEDRKRSCTLGGYRADSGEAGGDFHLQSIGLHPDLARGEVLTRGEQ